MQHLSNSFLINVDVKFPQTSKVKGNYKSSFTCVYVSNIILFWAEMYIANLRAVTDSVLLLCNTFRLGIDILTFIMTFWGCLCVLYANIIKLACYYQSSLNRNAKLVLYFKLLLHEACLLKTLSA